MNKSLQHTDKPKATPKAEHMYYHYLGLPIWQRSVKNAVNDHRVNCLKKSATTSMVGMNYVYDWAQKFRWTERAAERENEQIVRKIDDKIVESIKDFDNTTDALRECQDLAVRLLRGEEIPPSQIQALEVVYKTQEAFSKHWGWYNERPPNPAHLPKQNLVQPTQNNIKVEIVQEGENGIKHGKGKVIDAS